MPDRDQYHLNRLSQGPGMYSPLSQNMTDSDSSEEVHNIRRMSTAKSMSTELHKIDYNNGYRNCSNMDDGRFVLHQNSCTASAAGDLDDSVAILKASSRTEHMGVIRKGLFIFSIFLTIFTVVLFLNLPCTDDSITCPAMDDRIKTHNWLRSYENIEFKGKIYVVNGLRGRSNNLVAIYRKDKRVGDSETGSRKTNGIISLLGGTGGVAWYKEMVVNEPTAIDCSLIDVDLNGTPDCLVIDEFGEISCIDPLAGTFFWHIADHTAEDKKTELLLSFPLVLPDLNGDKVNELLITSSINSLIIVSGRNGFNIGSRYVLNECSFIHKFSLDADWKVSFICIRNETEVQMERPLADLFRIISSNRTIQLYPKKHQPQINQHKFYGQRKNTLRQQNIYSVSGKQLIVENKGRCPDNCNVSVELIEKKNGRNIVLRNFTGSRMYGMVPATMQFNSSRTNMKSGIVIKFWEWAAQESEFDHSKPKRSTSNEFDLFMNVFKKKRPWRRPLNDADVKYRHERNINTSKDSNEATLRSQMRLIKETVILIVFNSTDTKIENTSQSNIVQFCHGEPPEIECQPDLNYQENSLLIADLDQDGSQELLSFYSTYTHKKGNDTNDTNNWRLVTYLQLLRLEDELPKLYSTFNQN